MKTVVRFPFASQCLKLGILRFVVMSSLVFGPSQLLVARLAEHFTDEQAFAKADLIVIATVISTTDTDERSSLSDSKRSINVIGVTSDFEICAVLKGVTGQKKLRLHHYRTDDEFTNGPALVEIPRNKHPTYLLFLIRESDGRYAPATGQTDPSGSSVFLIRSSDERGFAASEPAAVCPNSKSTVAA
jgi:hypothetical protein